MSDAAIAPRLTIFGEYIHFFEHYSNSALTAAAAKKEWIVPFRGRIIDVIIDSETANSGEQADIADVNINGTTIYTTQANRPTLGAANTGMWAEAGEPEVTTLLAGDILSLDIDQIATTGSARVKALIIVRRR